MLILKDYGVDSVVRSLGRGRGGIPEENGGYERDNSFPPRDDPKKNTKQGVG